MKKKYGLTPNQEKILGILEYMKYKAIGRGGLIRLISKYRITGNPKYLIKSMLQKKRLISFKREHYIVIPMASVGKTAEVSEFELNEYFLGSADYYIGLYNAFNLHGFTGQVPNKMFVFNTKYSADKSILHYKFKYFKVGKGRLFGILRKYKYPYSDKERTIIDALDYPEYLGGIANVMDSIRQMAYNKTRLADYTARYGSIKVMKLAGFLTNSRILFDILKKRGALAYYTTVKKSKEKIIDKKWRIRMI